jgi:hypothetical protein
LIFTARRTQCTETLQRFTIQVITTRPVIQEQLFTSPLSHLQKMAATVAELHAQHASAPENERNSIHSFCLTLSLVPFLSYLFLSSFPYSRVSLFIHQWLYCPLLGSDLFFSIVIFFTQTVGLLGRAISPSQGRYLHSTTQTQNKRTQTSMP